MVFSSFIYKNVMSAWKNQVFSKNLQNLRADWHEILSDCCYDSRKQKATYEATEFEVNSAINKLSRDKKSIPDKAYVPNFKYS